MSVSTPNGNVVRKFNVQQEAYKNRQISHEPWHRRPSVEHQGQGSEDELSEAATISEESTSNHSLAVSSSYMPTKDKKEMYPVINDVRTLQVPAWQRATDEKEMQAALHDPPSEETTNSILEPDYKDHKSSTNTQVTPRRPQDLLHKVSLDLARENVKSSAQYRKSYAFKIWRDKGSFPYRLAEQPVVKEVVERKKSKKHLNAVRARKDRENEEAWRAFKGCRTTNIEMKYRRTSKVPRVRVDESLCELYEKEQLNTILSDTHDKDPKASVIKHQNSIPDYFKNKKESINKPQTSPTQSIPTSVIYVNITKACEISKQTSQAEQRMITFNNDHLAKSKTQAGFKSISNQTSERTLLAGREKEPISFSRWSNAQTSSGNFNIEHTQHQEHLNTNAVSSGQRSPSRTANSSSSLGRGTSSVMQEDHCSTKQQTAKRLASQRHEDQNIDTERLSTEEIEPNDTAVKDQSPTPSPTETASVSPEIDTSNLASIVKKSLGKKYSKENVKPNVGVTVGGRGTKRARNESASSEEEERRQRARKKQEKASMFTRLDEDVATNLADGIHNVNSEYFPIEALANKAAKETSNNTSDSLEHKVDTSSIKHKVAEIERARLLLKELFDVTSESGGDNEMKTFDVASRSFGRKNILNHLSLIDRYFAEFQKKLSGTDRPVALP